MSVLMHPETAIGQLKAGDYSFPLQSVDIKGTVRGLLYTATLVQEFKNERQDRMEAVYTFPLPPKAAVHRFVLRVGERVIEGQIKERGAARREYQSALRKGHRAALMEEERSDIFTTTVGNIGPGETVSIEFEMSGPLSFFRNTASLRIPLVVGEVFIPGRELEGNSVGSGTHVDTNEVPDASRITPPRLADGAPNPVNLSLSFMIEPAGFELVGASSACHFARVKSFEDGRYRVSLLPGVERMDRAFVLEITYPENKLQSSLLVDQESRAFCLTVVPPVAKERKTHPRDVVILLDRSGSMGGWPMIAARRAAARIVDSLDSDDRFGIICFDNQNEHFDKKHGLCHANDFYKMKAAEFLSKIDAQGGTMALPALQSGLQYFSLQENRDPHLILVTDGDVGNDSALIRSCQTGVRISTVGIGYAAREGLLNRMAETSGGVCSLIPNEADLDSELAEMHRRWGQPVWKGLSLRGADGQFRSPKFWDVWQERPATFFGKLDQDAVECAKTEVQGWFQGQGQFTQELAVTPTEDPVVFRSWARARLLDLEDLFLVNKATPAELVKLSVDAQVLCRFTAFSAVDTAEKVDMELSLNQAVQPVEQTIQKKQSAAKPMLMRCRSASSLPPAPPAPSPGGGGWLGGAGDDGGAIFGDVCEEALFDDGEVMDDCWGGDSAADLFCEADEWSAPEPPQEKRAKSEGGFLRRALGKLGMRIEKGAKEQAAPQVPAGKSLRDKVRELLAEDGFLNYGDAPSEAAIAETISRAKKLYNLIRAELANSGEESFWKEMLSKLMDYQEALEDKDIKAARLLRKELASMLN